MITYDLSLTTLSPLHIGEGLSLRRNFDFVVHGGKTYRLDLDSVLEAKGEQLKPDRRGNYPPPGSLLSPGDFKKAAFFRYVLPGEPRSHKTYAEVQSCIKDVHDRPYVPGSSLKGVLRTALAWRAWPERNIRLDVNRLGRNRKFAGQALEKQIFGKDPNHDLLRVLRVSDLSGAGKAGQGLALVNAQVLTKRETGSPIELEAVRGDVTFSGTLSLDDDLLKGEMARALGFEGQQPWLEDLATHLQAHSQERIEHLAAWFSAVDGAERIAAFYRKLANANLKGERALIQLGWGAGWDSKTFGSRLSQDHEQMKQIVGKYKLDRAGRGRSGAGRSFPASRRVVMKDGRQPYSPFGWCLLTLQRR